MIEKKLKACFYKIFAKKKITTNLENLVFKKFAAWDSLTHINLILHIEKIFSLKFTMKEISTLTSYKKLFNNLNKIKAKK